MHTPSSPRGRFGLLKSAPFSLAMLAASAMTANLAQADTVNVAAQTYDIPAGPLGSSLNRFAQQAGVAIVFQSHELEGLNGPGLKGQYTTVLFRLAWQDKLSFMLDDKMTVKRLKFEDLLQDQAEQDGGEEALGQLDASFTLMMLTFGDFLPALIEALGGEETPQGI